uniref:DUF1618 domain-containing protein n=1 Tax=Leersia perrieri TaxID=77586 RepID=A0A0D9W4J1_9ORYZ
MVDLCLGDPISHKLRRFNPSHLFYPNDMPPRDRTTAAAVEDARLPPPIMTFCSPGPRATSVSMEFMRRNDGKIVGVDHTGRSILYDDDAHTIRTLPNITMPKVWTMSVAIGDEDVYLMEMTPRRDGGSDEKPERSFEALVRRREGNEEDYFWRPLPPPPPPCVNAPKYFHGSGVMVSGYAAIGDSHILVSTIHGTYAFDTAAAAWSKAGDWGLPFVHVPEHGLWFGISDADDTVLAAWDLSSSPITQPPPAASLQSKGFSIPSWDGLPMPEVDVSHVVNLGDGKLCVAKLFTVDVRGLRSFAMLTGVEVVRRHGGKICVIKHKSRRYSFDTLSLYY